jgi:hypothetical protein
VEEFHSWLYTNSLRINAEKTTTMYFHTCKKKTPLKPQVKCDILDIAYKSETKFSGIHIRENIKWDVHDKSQSSKLGKICYMIQCLNDVMCPHVIRSNHYANFLAHLR